MLLKFQCKLNTFVFISELKLKLDKVASLVRVCIHALINIVLNNLYSKKKCEAVHCDMHAFQAT